MGQTTKEICSQCFTWCLFSLCALRSGSIGYAVVPLSGRTECKKMADADDECHKWRSSRKELPGFSGIYDCTGRSRVVSGCTPDGCGNLSFSEKILQKEGKLTAVGDEGGFAPDFSNAGEVFACLQRAVEEAGYKVGSDVAFAMDAAASELYSEEDGMYHFPGEAQTHAEVDVNLRRPDTQGGAYTSEAHVKTQEITEKEVLRSAQEMISLYEELTTEYPLISIEDGLDEDDWEGWQELTKRMKEQVMLVGDDLFVTNVKRIRCGMDLKVANAVLIKVNQIGTLTEAMDAIELAQKNGYKAIISHRSGETEDAFIADLAVAVNAGWIKTGAPCRGERTAKYNQLLRISETL